MHRYDRSRHAQWQQRLTELHDRARQLRARQGELRRWITEIDSELAQRSTLRDPCGFDGSYQFRGPIPTHACGESWTISTRK